MKMNHANTSKHCERKMESNVQDVSLKTIIGFSLLGSGNAKIAQSL